MPPTGELPPLGAEDILQKPPLMGAARGLSPTLSSLGPLYAEKGKTLYQDALHAAKCLAGVQQEVWQYLGQEAAPADGGDLPSAARLLRPPADNYRCAASYSPLAMKLVGHLCNSTHGRAAALRAGLLCLAFKHFMEPIHPTNKIDFNNFLSPRPKRLDSSTPAGTSLLDLQIDSPGCALLTKLVELDEAAIKPQVLALIAERTQSVASMAHSVAAAAALQQPLRVLSNLAAKELSLLGTQSVTAAAAGSRPAAQEPPSLPACTLVLNVLETGVTAGKDHPELSTYMTLPALQILANACKLNVLRPMLAAWQRPRQAAQPAGSRPAAGGTQEAPAARKSSDGGAQAAAKGPAPAKKSPQAGAKLQSSPTALSPTALSRTPSAAALTQDPAGLSAGSSMRPEELAQKKMAEYLRQQSAQQSASSRPGSKRIPLRTTLVRPTAAARGPRPAAGSPLAAGYLSASDDEDEAYFTDVAAGLAVVGETRPATDSSDTTAKWQETSSGEEDSKERPAEAAAAPPKLPEDPLEALQQLISPMLLHPACPAVRQEAAAVFKQACPSATVLLLRLQALLPVASQAGAAAQEYYDMLADVLANVHVLISGGTAGVMQGLAEALVQQVRRHCNGK